MPSKWKKNQQLINMTISLLKVEILESVQILQVNWYPIHRLIVKITHLWLLEQISQ